MYGQQKHARLVRGATAIVLLSAVGCGSTHDATVHGVVSLDGKPLDIGEVQFHSLGASGTAYGRLSAGGAYQLSTGQDSGIDPGEYQVTVVAREPFPENMPAGVTPPIPKVISPERYGRLETTPFKYTIFPGDNTIDLALTEK